MLAKFFLIHTLSTQPHTPQGTLAILYNVEWIVKYSGLLEIYFMFYRFAYIRDFIFYNKSFLSFVKKKI